MSLLVVDIGTSGVRSAIVRPDATIAVEHRQEVLPDTPAPGLVEFDATRMATAALATARAALAETGEPHRQTQAGTAAAEDDDVGVS